MLQIKKITIENFRGVKLPLIIDLYKGGNPTSAVIYGRNGTGKSAIVDAWEWLTTFIIQDLGKEGISTKDYPHKLSGGTNSYINVEFSHPTIKSAGAKFNKTKITEPITSGEYTDFKPHTHYPNYLRYSDLQEFVFLTKTEKYKYIAKFFGLEKFTKNQADIQTAFTRLKLQQSQYEKELNTNLSKVLAIIKQPQSDESRVIEFINSIAKKYKINTITAFKEAVKVKDALGELVKANPVAKRIAEWHAFQQRLNQFTPIPSIAKDCSDIETAVSELKKDEANISKLFLTALYEQGLETIANIEDKTICPLCDTTFGGSLVDHITSKHTALSELNKKKTEFDKKKSQIEKNIELIARKIHAIENEPSEEIKTTFPVFFELLTRVASALPALLAEIKPQLKDIQNLEISNLEVVSDIEKLIGEITTVSDFVSETLKNLLADENTKNLANDFAAIIQLITAHAEFSKAQAKVDYLHGINTNLELLFNELTVYIQNQIQTTFSSIQTDVIECFNILESGNQFLKNPEIKLVTGKDKAVELEIEFVSEKITPAYKFMSESQVNSFGLAIFLSSVKFFNKNFKFIILDDVVNSFDAFKRPKVVQLLSAKFSDFQFLILTHDQVFFDTVQKAFPEWQRYKFTSWDFATGPKFKLSNSYTEDIQECLNDDEPIKAGQVLGRYLEWTLGNVNEGMQTPLRYKVENVYTLAEFYDPLVARFKDKLKKKDATHKLIEAFNAIEQGTIFRNYCAHWKNEASPFTTPEIDAVFKHWMDIDKMLYCDSCKTNVHYIKDGSNDHVKCSCNKLDLRGNEFYSPASN